MKSSARGRQRLSRNHPSTAAAVCDQAGPRLEGWTPAFIVSLLRTRLQALRVSAGLRETRPDGRTFLTGTASFADRFAIRSMGR
jgi:hypothetical protein